MELIPRTEAHRLGDRSRSRTNRERGIRPKRSKHVLRINETAFVALMREHRRFSHESVASFLELGVGTVHSALKGRPVGDAFVSAVLKKIRGTHHRIEDLFVEGDLELEEAAA